MLSWLKYNGCVAECSAVASYVYTYRLPGFAGCGKDNPEMWDFLFIYWNQNCIAALQH